MDLLVHSGHTPALPQHELVGERGDIKDIYVCVLVCLSEQIVPMAGIHRGVVIAIGPIAELEGGHGRSSIHVLEQHTCLP